MTARVSLAMLAEKDSPTLRRCLDSVADLVSEIVVVTQPGATATWADSFRSSGVKLVEFSWCDSFSAARNESLKHATGDWILYLDADEWLDDENRSRLRALLRSLPQSEVAGYTLSQVSREFSGRARSLEQVRLFRNSQGLRWIYRVHEQIAPALKRAGGEILSSDIEIAHEGYVSRATLAAKGRRNARLIALDLRERPDDGICGKSVVSRHVFRIRSEFNRRRLAPTLNV